MWKQDTGGYGQQIPRTWGPGFSVKKGQVYNIMITKQNIGPESNPTGVDITVSVNGTQYARWRDTNSQPLRGIPPYFAIPGSRAGYRNDGLLNCYEESCCTNDKHRPGPSVICGKLWYKPMPILPA